MVTVNHQTNRVSSVKAKVFNELGYTEREHFQLSNRLGLLIQNGFDGFVFFSFVRNIGCERLDLLELKTKLVEEC